MKTMVRGAWHVTNKSAVLSILANGLKPGKDVPAARSSRAQVMYSPWSPEDPRGTWSSKTGLIIKVHRGSECELGLKLAVSDALVTPRPAMINDIEKVFTRERGRADTLLFHSALYGLPVKETVGGRPHFTVKQVLSSGCGTCTTLCTSRRGRPPPRGKAPLRWQR